MANHGASPMRRIESGPSGAGQKRLNPRVAREFGRCCVSSPRGIRREIAGYIASRNSRKAEQTDTQMREILAHSAARSEYVVDGRVYVRGPAVVSELATHVEDRALGVLG